MFLLRYLIAAFIVKCCWFPVPAHVLVHSSSFCRPIDSIPVHDQQQRIACSFGKKEVEMIVLSDSHAMRTVPTVSYTSTASDISEGLQEAFKLSLPEADQVVGGPNKHLMYTYYSDESITDISPRLLMPILLRVQNPFIINGRGTLDTYELSCNVGNAVGTEAVHISSSSVSCPVPSAMTIFGSREITRIQWAILASQWTSIEFYEKLRID